MVKICVWISIACLVAWAIFFGIMSDLKAPDTECIFILVTITVAIAVGSFALSYLGGHTIKRNKGAIRLSVLISLLCIIIFWLLAITNEDLTIFPVFGIIPVTLYWGILWVITGFLPNIKNKNIAG